MSRDSNTNNNLLQYIQQEIDEEARIDKKIEMFKRKFLRQPSNRKYKPVNNIEESDIILLFIRSDLNNYLVLSKDQLNDECFNERLYSMFFLKSTNPSDRKLHVIGDFYRNKNYKNLAR